MSHLPRHAVAIFALGLAAAPAAPRAVAGEHWTNFPSYFSHAVAAEQIPHHPVPIARAAYRPAAVSPYPGFSVRSGFRINRVTIRSGASRDTTVLGGAFLEVRP